MAEDLKIKYIPYPVDVLVINDIQYSGDLFRGISGVFEIGTCFQIVKREDGAVHVRRIPAPLEAEEKEGSHEV